jgi:formylglycine-generating enzyme required for sulfatase activity
MCEREVGMRKAKYLSALGTAALILSACGGIADSGAGTRGHAEAQAPEWARVAPDQIAEAKKHGVPVAFENDLGMRFVLVPAGSFIMGWYSPARMGWRSRGCLPPHRVTLTRPFYVQTTEVTNSQFRKYRPGHDSGAVSVSDTLLSDGNTFREYLASVQAEDREVRTLDGDAQPAVLVSWDQAREFADWLSARDRAHSYSLPSEAQWEYACRAATTTRFAFGDSISTDQANFAGQRNFYGPDGVNRDTSVPVMSFPANSWSLHEMHGNVAEWCLDGYANDGHFAEDRVDPLIEATGEGRHVVRGGSWHSGPALLISAWRDFTSDDEAGAVDVGFRLISPLPKEHAALR